MTRRNPRRRTPKPRELKAPADWSGMEARARAAMGRSRAQTLSGESYRAQAPSTYRVGGKRTGGTRYS